MSNIASVLDIIQAANSKTILDAAIAYMQLGFSVLPLKGKRPTLENWKLYQEQAATLSTIEGWHKAGLLQNVGLVCGEVSGNRVALDLDSAAGYPAFAATFPALAETYTVATGGGIGKHIYWQVEQLPPAVKAMGTPLGNLEMCASGRQIVAPPSIHPTTHNLYRVDRALPILLVTDLCEVVEWIESFKKNMPSTQTHWQPPRNMPTTSSDLNPQVIEELARHFTGIGYQRYGDWLHGRCVYPSRHKNGDRHPSFGFNTQTGYGYCFKCGTLLAKDLCYTLGIHPEDFGGLMMRQANLPPRQSSVNLSDIPTESPFSPVLPLQPPTPPMPIPAALPDADGSDLPPNGSRPVALDDLKLPNWLRQYLDWAGRTGNQTPLDFHLAAGLWLLSVAVGRRLFGEAPWGIKIYTNLYLMLIADTTYYRKSTAYKLAEQIAREAIPHMLMPTPGSPERFQEALAGRMPANFDKLTKPQQERLTKAQPFAAQRGLLKDEVAGLFGAINKREYMVGMKDLLMELYDCPDYSDKDTQAGLTVVENAALSILGVTTPAGLSAAISDADWANGLLIRFALLTPEPNYQERPALKAFQLPPKELAEGLRHLHDKLPQPQMTEMGLAAPGSLKLNVQCWEACQSYSQLLRELCNPHRDVELDERLKGVYGRMHVQAFKLAALLAALDWLETEEPAPIVTEQHWESGKAIAEMWRGSAARLLHQMDRSGEAVQEQRDQSKLLMLLRKSATQGSSLRDIYRALNLPAKRARQLAQDLVRAGLIVERLAGRAEWYVSVEFLTED
ncbi:MAG: hypothetical protein BroJett018_20490 [Chloroflexota bacterium]|nr:MAG: hypothetical protein BroJett018_20490 [Chloroflexota bacterium]